MTANEEEIKYEEGYEKGWADAQEFLFEKVEKILLKTKTEAYDKGYQEGANQKRQ